ncbi:MAG: hypothetical protein RIT04_464 [Candidatus Parcubacteria bacterium]|jgi:hypothetical protein
MNILMQNLLRNAESRENIDNASFEPNAQFAPWNG